MQSNSSSTASFFYYLMKSMIKQAFGLFLKLKLIEVGQVKFGNVAFHTIVLKLHVLTMRAVFF